jgi:hypothetical protein
MVNSRWVIAVVHETADATKHGASGKKVEVQNNAYHEHRKKRFSKKSHAKGVGTAATLHKLPSAGDWLAYSIRL